MTTTTHKGKLCGTWEDAVERNRAMIPELPGGQRSMAEEILDLHLSRFASEPRLSPEQIDERIQALDCAIPQPLAHYLGDSALSLEEVIQQLDIVTAELAELKRIVVGETGRPGRHDAQPEPVLPHAFGGPTETKGELEFERCWQALKALLGEEHLGLVIDLSNAALTRVVEAYDAGMLRGLGQRKRLPDQEEMEPAVILGKLAEVLGSIGEELADLGTRL